MLWDQPRCTEEVIRDTTLDSSLPMPGLVLQFTLREPLELNVERSALESVGLLQGLFTKSANAKGPKGETDEAQEKKRNAVTYSSEQ